MNNLLIERHPDITDIGESQVKKILKYTNLDENGKILECLQRRDTDSDFVDVTEIERERVAILKCEQELYRMRHKEQVINAEKTTDNTESNS